MAANQDWRIPLNKAVQNFDEQIQFESDLKNILTNVRIGAGMLLLFVHWCSSSVIRWSAKAIAHTEIADWDGLTQTQYFAGQTVVLLIFGSKMPR